jgi:DNA topoisomerase-3
MRALLQHRVTSDPIELADGQQFVLTLLDSGDLVEIPLPKGDEQTARKSSSGPTRNRQSSQKATTGKASRQSIKEKSSTDIGACPLCGAKVVEQKKSFSCSRWQAGCKLTIWKSMSGKRISARTAKSLLQHGKSSVLKGFKSKSGQPFSARLKLHEGKVSFDFDE